MGLTDKLQNISAQAEAGAKKITHGFFHISFRLVTGFFLGLVLALVFQELWGYQTLLLIFMTTTLMALIYKSLAQLSLLQILVFDLICILVLTLLKMYVLIAPQAQ
jgi:hypothetical protein